MDQLRGLIRPPFANYDVVVYFGGGLFSLAFIYRYLLLPLNLRLPTFSLPISQPFLSDAVAILTTLFVIYVLGHLIAYCGSQFIEKFIDRIFGKVSSAIFVSSRVDASMRNEYIRALIYDRIAKIRRDRGLLTTIVRAVAHLPALPLYIAIFGLGVFGYYGTRVPYSVLHQAGQKMRGPEFANCRIGLRKPWYKPLEYYVINRCPSAVNRMYNYLVISGLFRTLATVFLFSLWMQIYYLVHYRIDGDWMLSPFMGYAGPNPGLVEYVIAAVAFCFCLFSYLKFQRRYAEEAIFAFVYGESGESVTTIKHRLDSASTHQ